MILRILALSVCLGLQVVTGLVAAQAQSSDETIVHTGPGDRAMQVFEFWTPDRIAAAQGVERLIPLSDPAVLESLGASMVTPQQSSGVSIETLSVTGPPPGVYAYSPGTTPLEDLPELVTDTVTFQALVWPESSTIESVHIDARETIGPFFIDDGTRRGGLIEATRTTPQGWVPESWEVELPEMQHEAIWTWQAVVKEENGRETRSERLWYQVENPDAADRHPPVDFAEWKAGGGVQSAVGRLFFQMRADLGDGPQDYLFVCSGTVINDEATDRSVILTAAHCIYNEDTGSFATNTLFIPNQAHTTGERTDFDCFNDPLGCWAPAFGVVDRNWARGEVRGRPNLPWDYGYYVVENAGAHQGPALVSEALDEVVTPFLVDFSVPELNDGSAAEPWTFGFGYEGRFDPALTFCADGMTREKLWNQYDSYLLPYCGMLGGSSGGPWVNGLDPSTVVGKIVSVNSYGYVFENEFTGEVYVWPGMRGPKLHGNTAQCMLEEAKSIPFESIIRQPGLEGTVMNTDCRFSFWFNQ